MEKIKPTDSELEILQVLWAFGASSVRFVNEELNKSREVGYTTTLKLMQIMTDKQLVGRDTSKRTHIYSALVEKQQVQQNLLNNFLQKTFGGSASQLVMQALGNHQASDEELDAIKQMIAELEKKKQA